MLICIENASLSVVFEWKALYSTAIVEWQALAECANGKVCVNGVMCSQTYTTSFLNVLVISPISSQLSKVDMRFWNLARLRRLVWNGRRSNVGFEGVGDSHLNRLCEWHAPADQIWTRSRTMVDSFRKNNDLKRNWSLSSNAKHDHLSYFQVTATEEAIDLRNDTLTKLKRTMSKHNRNFVW